MFAQQDITIEIIWNRFKQDKHFHKRSVDRLRKLLFFPSISPSTVSLNEMPNSFKYTDLQYVQWMSLTCPLEIGQVLIEDESAAPTLKVRCIMGSTWTCAAFQSVVIRFLTSSDSRQHMVLYLSLERHTLDPRTSASAADREQCYTPKSICTFLFHD